MALKPNLIEITQQILSDMGGDEVNSMFDTTEAEQVGRIIVQTYKSMMSNALWPHTQRALVLEAYSDSDYPTHMEVKSNLLELVTDSVKYDKRKLESDRKNYQPVWFAYPDEFLRHINQRDDTSDTVDVVMDKSGIELMIINNAAPQYFTTFDDETLVFDSYDKEVDSTLQESKLQARGYIMPDLLLEDTAVPDLPVDAFAALIEGATSRAQFKLRQVQDVVSGQEAAKQNRWLSRKRWTVNELNRYPNYGRKNNGYRKDATFRNEN